MKFDFATIQSEFRFDAMIRTLAHLGSDAVEPSCLGHAPHWPVLTRPRLAGFQVSTEVDDKTGPVTVASASILMLLRTQGGKQYSSCELSAML